MSSKCDDMEKVKSLYQDLKNQIKNVEYHPSGGIDWPLNALSIIREKIASLFLYSEFYNELCELCDAKKREVISSCLYDLLRRKDELHKTAVKQIEYVVTSIFSYIFSDFNIAKALEQRYGPNYNTVIEKPNQESPVFISWYRPSFGRLSSGKIENRLLPKCKLSNVVLEGDAGKIPVLDCIFIKEEKVGLNHICLLRSKDIFITISQKDNVIEDQVMFFNEISAASKAFEELKEQLK